MSGEALKQDAPPTKTPAASAGVVAAARVTPAGPPSGSDAVLALQRMAGNRATTRAIRSQQPSGDAVADGGGAPLGGALRDDLERRFDFDFADVRVHTNATAARSASALSAKAYTVGHDIVFSEGRFAPQSDAGKHLLAHELAHVVQQSRGHARAHSAARTEADARVASADVSAGRQATVAAAAAPGSIQCAPEDEKRSTLGRLWGAAKGTAKAAGNAAASVVDSKLQSDKEAASIFKMGEEGVNKDLDKLEARANKGNEKWIEETKDSPVMNKVARVSAAINKFSTEVSVGAVKATVGMIGGAAQVGLNPVGTIKDMAVNSKAGPLELASRQATTEVIGVGKGALSGKMPTLGSAAKAVDRVGMAAEQGVINNVEAVQPFVNEYIEAGKKGKYGEIPGRAIVDVGSFFIGGGAGKAGKLAKVAEVAKAAEVAKGAEIAKGTGQLARGSQVAGEASKAATLGKTGELGKTAELAKTAEAGTGLAGTAPKPGLFGAKGGLLSSSKTLQRLKNTAAAGFTRISVALGDAIPVLERGGSTTHFGEPAAAVASEGGSGARSAGSHTPSQAVAPTSPTASAKPSAAANPLAEAKTAPKPTTPAASPATPQASTAPKPTAPVASSAAPQAAAAPRPMAARKPSGFSTDRATPGRNIKPGTLEGLEGTQHRRAPQPRSGSVTRAEQLEGLEARAPRASPHAFMEDSLAKVSDSQHPLHHLVEPGAQPGTHRWKTTTRTTRSGKVQQGRYPGSETDPIVHAGHEEAYAAGGEQKFALEDADMNISSGASIESKGAFSIKEKVLVTLADGSKPVAVELESLKQWERLGAVPEGTTARAIEHTAAVEGGHALPAGVTPGTNVRVDVPPNTRVVVDAVADSAEAAAEVEVATEEAQRRMRASRP